MQNFLSLLYQERIRITITNKIELLINLFNKGLCVKRIKAYYNLHDIATVKTILHTIEYKFSQKYTEFLSLMGNR